jgi:hypothetical protein
MKLKTFIFIAIATVIMSFRSNPSDMVDSKSKNFNKQKDLLLAQFDCKTDVDDLNTVAALATLLSDPEYIKIRYHAVAGAYGIQEGLYVPPNDLFQLAFGDNWTDAHNNVLKAVQRVKNIVESTLNNDGDIWIAEAGQSDFTARLIKALQSDLPSIDLSRRVHVVQHSDWNEQSTSPESLKFVKRSTDYHKIPDGNVVGNGTPGFRDPDYTDWKDRIKDPKLSAIWELALSISARYNGKDGRYNNEAISSGGLDFSDLCEVCWILGLEDIRDVNHFFKLFSR